MIYAAEINYENVVVRVIAATTLIWCTQNLGGVWLETWKDGSRRGKFAGPGDIYDADADEFVSPPDDETPE
jgi:hypothetical protein